MIQIDSKKILSAVLEKFDSVRRAAAAVGIAPISLKNVLRGKRCSLQTAKKIIEYFQLVEGTDYHFVERVEGKKNSVA